MPPRRGRPAARAALLLLLAALAAGCSSAGRAAPPTTTGAPETTTTTEAPTTTTTAPPPPTYPLSGRQAPDAAAAQRPAVAVKIDNIAAARPQAGVAAADVVYEEFTEGVTRFIAVYQSTDADVVGPVRSVRPADPVILTPLGGLLGFSGGSPGAEGLARAAPLAIVTETDTEVMYRRPGRVAPHNLYTSTQALYSRMPAEAKAPPKLADFLPPGKAFTGPGAAPVTSISMVPAPYVTAAYDWDPGSATWLRTTDGSPHAIEEGRIAPTTVIVQYVPYVTYIDDENVMYPEVVGSGEAWFFAGATMVKGTWSKASPEAVTTFADANGSPLALPPGQTWIHLVAPGAAVSAG